VPDIELIFYAGSIASDEGAGLRRAIALSEPNYNAVFKTLEDTNIDSFMILPMLFHPKSVGYLEVTSSNIFHWPKLYHNYLTNPDDVETILEGIKYAIRISNAPPFQKLGTRLHSIPLPNCAHLHFGSDNYWRCSIRTLSNTLYHEVSTNRMGPASDPTAVVSPELKVHGIKNLRVADSSIIPEAPTSHTNAATYMIGEKCADMIQQEWMS
jgi:choline dehydrogenase-like flavoprotein